jgi:transitional endoplasmic reticulum ATPase
VEKARSLRNTEFEVAMLLRHLPRLSKKTKENFVKFNFKTLMGILEAVEGENPLKGVGARPPGKFHRALRRDPGADQPPFRRPTSIR